MNHVHHSEEKHTSHSCIIQIKEPLTVTGLCLCVSHLIKFLLSESLGFFSQVLKLIVLYSFALFCRLPLPFNLYREMPRFTVNTLLTPLINHNQKTLLRPEEIL